MFFFRSQNEWNREKKRGRRGSWRKGRREGKHEGEKARDLGAGLIETLQLSPLDLFP